MIIYLDIDGVMVPANSWRQPEFLEDGFVAFGKQSVDALNSIISSSNASIILTTSHKHSYTLKVWGQIFEKRGVLKTQIDRLPKNISNLSRKQELLNWFDSCNLDNFFIILDDDKSLNALPEFYKHRLVQTNASVGLTGDLANEALDIIERLGYELV